MQNPYILIGAIIGLVIYIGICHLIAEAFVKSKHVTYDWAMFFMLTGGILFGVIILLFMDDIRKEKVLKPSSRSTYMGLAVFFMIGAVAFAFGLLLRKIPDSGIGLYAEMYALFMGAAIYNAGKVREIEQKPTYSGYFAGGAVLLGIFISLTVFGWSDILMH